MNSIYTYSLLPARRQKGLSLVEILVALMISAFLISGVIQLFIGSKQTYRSNDALSRIQENGRFVLEAMARDIRMTAYYPRVTTRTISGVTVTEEVGEPPKWPSIEGNRDAIYSVRDDEIILKRCSNEEETNIAIDACGDKPPRLKFLSHRYFIAPRTVGSETPTCPGAANSLFVQRDGNPPQELIEGVQLMRIFYGEDTLPTGGTPSVARQYVPVGGVGNWNNVVSVQINLLLVSLENNLITTPQGQQQTVVFPDNAGNLVSQAVSGRCLGQVFSTTVALRNLP